MSLGGGGSSTPAPTAEEKALAERGALEFNDYVERYIPLEDKAIELATPRPELADRLRGEAVAERAAGLRGEYAKRIAADYARGGGGAAPGIDELSTVGAAAAAQGASMADHAVKERELKAKTKLTAFGRGLADQSSLNLSRAGSNSTRLALQDFKNKMDEQQARMGLLGTLAGAGLAATGEKYRDFKKQNPEKGFSDFISDF